MIGIFGKLKVEMKHSKKHLAITIAAVLLVASSAAWLIRATHRPTNVPKMVYDPHGYGGFVPVRPPQDKRKVSREQTALQSSREAYENGRYTESEYIASALIKQASPKPSTANRAAIASARQILAYTAAREHNMKLAQQRFAMMEQTASTLPGGGDQSSGYGDPTPPLEQEAAFEHAVCTAALGDKASAEVEYRAFIYRFPQSTLVRAAADRIARMHGGNLPPIDVAAWKGAQRVTLRAAQTLARDEAMCGPACVAELLQRKGESARIESLANEMGTTDKGTSLAAIAESLDRRGYRAQGMLLTMNGLAEQRFPVIAFLAPGHFVIVDGLSSKGVTIWDPDARGTVRGGPVKVTVADWQRCWQGTALGLSGGSGSRSASGKSDGFRLASMERSND
jgi:TolA-binding protein